VAKKYKKIVTADPNKNNHLNWKGLTAVKPNRDEAHQALSIDAETTTLTIDQIGNQLVKKWQASCILMTLGGEGMKVFGADKKPYHVAAHALDVFEVSGAGDTAMAFFVAALAAKYNASEAAEIANLASSIVVGKFGVATVLPEEFVNFFDKSKKIKAARSS
jgi:D-beta-D-heptose 7-phosphate kinase/D-beta-D-heptose 1-phosphate adenosyltransferase